VRFEEMMAGSRSYTELGDFTVGFEDMALSGAGEPETLKGARVSANFLHILGVSPLLGRSFLPEEDKAGAPAVAMISAELWRRRFGGDRSIVGKGGDTGGMPYEIVGVLPAGFQFPLAGSEVWVTRPSEWSAVPPQGRPLSPILSVFGRLKPGLDLRQATAELAVLNRQYAAAHPGMLDAKPGIPETVQPFGDQLVSEVRSETVDAVRSCRVCAADRLREHRKFTAGARGFTFAGICGASRDWGWARADHWAATG